MHVRRSLLAGTAVAALAVAAAGCGSSKATKAPSFPTGSAESGSLRVTGAYVPQNASPDVAAAYFTVTDTGAADTLMSVSSPISTDVGLHKTVEHGSTGQMVPVASLPVPKNGSLTLSPGGYHVMLMKPSALTVGQQVNITLHFAHAGNLVVQAPVVPLTAANDDMGSMQMGGM